jgi:hypothetical protein
MAVEEKSREDADVLRSGLQVLASIEQGFRLRGNADRLGYGRNSEFGGDLVMATRKNASIELDGSLKVTVVGPMKPELKKLQEKHQAWLKEMKDKGTPVTSALAYVDRSVPNLQHCRARGGGKETDAADRRRPWRQDPRGTGNGRPGQKGGTLGD